MQSQSKVNYNKWLFLVLFFCCPILSFGQQRKELIVPQAHLTSGDQLVAYLSQLLVDQKLNHTKVVIPKGVYHISANDLRGKNLYITNHDAGDKQIAFPIEKCHNLEIDGSGSKFIFKGRIMPFYICQSSNISIENLIIDWEIPFFVQGKITKIDSSQGYYDVKMYEKGYSYDIFNGQLRFPNVDGFAYTGIGESLIFDEKSRQPIYNASLFDIHRRGWQPKVEQVEKGSLRIYERLKSNPPLNSVMTYKGEMGANRYAPCFYVHKSKGTAIKNVTIHHALGMGVLGEFSENLLLSQLTIKPSHDRMVSVTADATHFSNCKGTVVIDKAHFSGMLDDGVNIHGVYTEVDSLINRKELQVRLKHYQQRGYSFATPGDSVWFIQAPSMSRGEINVVEKVELINPTLIRIRFKNKIERIKKGDLVENKSWNTDYFAVTNSVMQSHRARNIVLKAPGKIEIRNNILSSMMSSILIRNEAFLWYESGAVEQVEIIGNKFQNVLYGGGNHALLMILPRFHSHFDKLSSVAEKIVFRENTVDDLYGCLVKAAQINQLVIEDNQVKWSHRLNLKPGAKLIQIDRTDEVKIKNNQLSKTLNKILKTKDCRRVEK